ncbi:MAG: hypothetical protein Q4E13_05600 [Clostridia bacterium]|nr:hypothetical protein [Clostridia bacterium]
MSSGQMKRGWSEKRGEAGERILSRPWGSGFSAVTAGQYAIHSEWLNRLAVPGILIEEDWQEEIEASACIVRSEQAYWLEAARAYRSFSRQQITKLLGDIAEAAAGVHECGLILAEISDENVLLQGEGDNAHAMLAGLLSAVSLEDDDELLLTTSDYASPEARRYAAGDDQIRLTAASDIFSLGVLFHQYLTGTMPSFEEYTPEGIPDGRAKLSRRLTQYHKALIEQMLEIDPDDRPTDADEVAGIMRRIQRMGESFIRIEWDGHSEEILTISASGGYRSWKRLDENGTAVFGPMLADEEYLLFYQAKQIITLRFPEAAGGQKITVRPGRSKSEEKAAQNSKAQEGERQESGYVLSPPVNNICRVEMLTGSRCRLTLINNGTFQINSKDAEKYGIAHILEKLTGR